MEGRRLHRVIFGKKIWYRTQMPDYDHMNRIEAEECLE